MKCFLDFLNESNDFLFEAFSSEMKSVFTKAQLANAGRAAAREVNIDKTTFKKVDPSVITKSAKTLNNKMVFVKTKTGGAYLIKYKAGADKPILVYNLNVNTKNAYWTDWKDARNTESRKDIAANAEHVFMSDIEALDRYDIQKQRSDNKPEPEPSDLMAKYDLKDRLAKFKFDKEKENFLLDTKKSFTENGELIAEKVKEHIINLIRNTNVTRLQYMKFDDIKSLASAASSYQYQMDNFEKGEIDSYNLNAAKRYFDKIISAVGK